VSRRCRGVSIPMGGGEMLCPICGESYRRGTYKNEHRWASSAHVSELYERRRRRRRKSPA
jgi:hypothetical protein